MVIIYRSVSSLEFLNLFVLQNSMTMQTYLNKNGKTTKFVISIQKNKVQYECHNRFDFILYSIIKYMFSLFTFNILEIKNVLDLLSLILI